MPRLFDPIHFGNIVSANRIVKSLMATYYREEVSEPRALIQVIEGATGKARDVTTFDYSNPDLVHRLRLDADLATPESMTFYCGRLHGYADYPVLEPAVA